MQALVERAWRALFADTRAVAARHAARCEDANEPQIGASYSVSSPSFIASPTSLAADSHAPSWNPDAVAPREPLAARLLQNVLNAATRKFGRAEQRPHPASFARDPHFMTPHNDAEDRRDDELAIPVLRKRAAR